MTTTGSDALVALVAPEFDLDLTLECGQVFHWQREGAGWLGALHDQPCYVEQTGNSLLVPEGMEEIARKYFALDHPLTEISGTFPRDPMMTRASAFCHGMRIIRQPPWECLATFITSSMKQVSHIAQMSRAIRRRFGQGVDWNDRSVFTYPSAERLAQESEAALRACSLGYRAKYLLATARMIASGEVPLAALEELDDAHARAELRRLPGVGEKVADCVLLFGFGRLGAFPIDVWIERVLREIYFQRKRKVTAKKLRDFSRRYFGEFGGYAQQYLFHHARKTWQRGQSGRKPARSRAPRPQ
jgi:N-glycosylase/DNA lyase